MNESDRTKPKFNARFLKTVLFKRPVRVFCKECQKYIPSTMEWVCGFCGMEHHNVRVYSFLYKCKRCKRKPEAFACPHCGTTWCFEENGDASHPARKYQAKPPALPVENEGDKHRREHEEKKRRLQFRIDEAKLEAELKQLEARLVPKAPTSDLEAKFLRDQERFLGVKEILARWKKIYLEAYPEGSPMREDALAFLKSWGAEHVP